MSSVPASTEATTATIDHPHMYVTKRSGAKEPVDVNKIVHAVSRVSDGLNAVDPMRIALKTIGGLYDGATTQELDQLSIRTAAALTAEEPEYSQLAARLLSAYIGKEVANQDIQSFSQSIALAHAKGIVNERVKAFVDIHARKLNDAVRNNNDRHFEYFGLKTVYDRYLLRHPTSRLVIETPQYFFMRVACALGNNDIFETLELYRLYSKLDYMSSSPTLFNAGCVHEQMSSCYLLDSPEDSLEGIYGRYMDIAKLSKYAGGIGVAWSRVRSTGSHIKGTNGISNGIVPWLHTLDASVLAVNQSGKRKGAAAVYLEPWHADIESFLELRDNTGDHERRTHNLNLANWIPDLFMKRVNENGDWSLFDPKDTPELVDTYGQTFEALYLQYEVAGLAKKTVKARDLYARMMRTLAQTGNGWMNFKDRSNATSNQTAKAGNVIHLSNLCVAGDTTIETKEGIRIIEQSVGKQTIWNGEEWSEVDVVKTGENQPLLKVVVGDKTLECTPYHKWYLASGEEVRTTDLKAGDKLLQWSTVDGSIVCDTISSVTDEGKRGDTYCFTEPKRHMGVFNGILTGQCTEILEVTSESQTAVCNLGSVNLAHHVRRDSTGKAVVDYEKISRTVKAAVRQLNRVIDINFYPIDTAKSSNAKWRPVGLGLMGLQDVFFQLGLPFDSEEAKAISASISEHVYFHALKQSVELAKEFGPHDAFKDTRAAEGELQFDYWPNAKLSIAEKDWETLRQEIKLYGLRNSLIIAIAPTATIASITGAYECIEPQVSNLFKRETLSGDFLVINRYLVEELKKLSLWTPEVRDAIKLAEGSIQGIEAIPDSLKVIYRTAWELPQRALIDHAAARGAFIDQSQSLNLFMENPNIGQLSSMYMYAWKSGIKTTYYLRSRAATKIAKTTVQSVTSSPSAKAVEMTNSVQQEEAAAAVFCSLENPETCLACQ